MIIISLAELYQNFDNDKHAIQAFLQNFACAKNQDVEDFLLNKALRFEESHNARTYLVVSETQEILAYFALSFKEVMLANAKISKAQVKQLDGISKNAERIRVFLIGQIGKNSLIEQNPVTLNQIFAEIFAIFKQAQILIGGRAVVLECQPLERLIQLYEQHGFKTLPIVTNVESEMVTMYHAI